MAKLVTFYTLLFYMFISACSKESIDSSIQNILKFSTDTLSFDTVFQSLGSATRSFRIYNSTDKTILISKVSLRDGTSSSFRFNIDGISGPIAENIQILPQDSLWIFVEVKVNPAIDPLLIIDSLIVESNGGKQHMILRAFGQNVYMHIGEILTSNTTWQNDKPHVIIEKSTISGLIPGVIIPQGIKLQISAGAQLHFSSSAAIYVQGTLESKGTSIQPILMRGLRLEQPFIHAAGQWLGVLFERGSIGNQINYTTIDESVYGLYLSFQSSLNFSDLLNNSTRPKLVIKNSTIKNAYYFTIRSFNAIVDAENCQFFTSTEVMSQFLLGGEYKFKNCTFYNTQSKDGAPLFLLSNQFKDENTNTFYTQDLTNTLFENCIFNTNVDESIVIDMNSTKLGNYSFTNSNYNSKSNLSNSNFINCQLNQNPQFANTTIDAENLSLKAGSPCIDAGKSNLIITDILGKARPNGAGIDIGAFEF